MQIGIVGAGKVGCSMGKYMREHELPLVGYYSRSIESSEEAGTFTGTKCFQDLEGLVNACDVLCIATPDDAIGEVWTQIREMAESKKEACTLEHKVVCHFSGSLSSGVFSDIDRTGASACSVHPMFAFSDKYQSYQQLHSVIFAMEGQEKACEVVSGILSSMGNEVLRIRPEKKTLYHCSAALVSNYMIGLYQMGLELLGECGLEREDAGRLFAPLVENNIEKMLSCGPEQALSGPIERGDSGTIQKHLNELEGDAKQIYRLLGKKVLSVARQKNPERDYEAVMALLK